jgi:hypothetical protein
MRTRARRGARERAFALDMMLVLLAGFGVRNKRIDISNSGVKRLSLVWPPSATRR